MVENFGKSDTCDHLEGSVLSVQFYRKGSNSDISRFKLILTTFCKLFLKFIDYDVTDYKTYCYFMYQSEMMKNVN